MIPVSVYVICFNEQRHIKRLLDHLVDFKEIILVDSGSTDQTLDIARSFSNVRIYHRDWEGFSSQKAYALSLCTCSWVLNLDCDEVISPLMKEELCDLIKQDHYDALSSLLCDTFLGKIPHRFTKHHDKIRFFKKDSGRYHLDDLVHESIKITGRVKKGKGQIYHYGLLTQSIAIQKNYDYARLAAQQKFQKGKKTNTFKITTIFLWAFLKAYVIRRYCFDGLTGFIYSMNIAQYAFWKEVFLYEHQTKRTI